MRQMALEFDPSLVEKYPTIMDAKWIDEPLDENQTPAAVLRQAAKVFELDAKDFIRRGEYALSGTANYYANVLKRVADGKSWAAAFVL